MTRQSQQGSIVLGQFREVRNCIAWLSPHLYSRRKGSCQRGEELVLCIPSSEIRSGGTGCIDNKNRAGAGPAVAS